MKRRIAIFFLLLLGPFASLLIAQVKSIPFQQLPTAGGAPIGSNMFFSASMSPSTITINFVGPSDRWIAIGFGSSMPNTDALIYSVGQNLSPHPQGWYDYYISSYSGSGVTNDAVQNWTIQSNNVAAGQRTVVATRTLNTGDANDAVIQYTAPALSLVWARGASADYTIAYHGSNNRANNISLPWLTPPTASFVTASQSLCAGSSLSFSNLSTGGQLSYTWNFQGGSPATSTLANPIVSYSSPGNYSVSLTCSNALGVSNFTINNAVSVSPTLTPSISISQIAGLNPMCAGTLCSFSAAIANGGPAPGFQWKVNGANSGSNSPVFTSSGISVSSTIQCVLISNATCSNPSTVTSAPLSLTVNSTAAASLSISQHIGNNLMCVGALAGFSASAFNGGSSPQFQWKVNGLPAGPNANTFTSSTIQNGDQVSCEMISSNTCASNTLALSPVLTMSVSTVLVPSLTLSLISGTLPSCAGSPLTFSLNTQNTGSNPVVNWKVNALQVASGSLTYSTSNLLNGDILICEVQVLSSCANPSVVNSNAITLSITPLPPSPTISISGSPVFCQGDSVWLSSSAATGNLWNNGSNSNSLLVTGSGSFQVQQILNGCLSPPSQVFTTQVLALPQITVQDIPPLCLEDAPLSLNFALPTGGSYSGAAVNNGIFDPQSAGTGTTLVIYTYTDANSCSASDSIVMSIELCTTINEASRIPSESLLLFPNPVSERIRLESDQERLNHIEILDAQLKVLYFIKDVELPFVYDFKGHEKGIYFLRAQFQNRHNSVYKIIYQ